MGQIVTADINETDSPEIIIAKILYIINNNSVEISRLEAEKVDRSEITNFVTIDTVREMIKEAVDWHVGCWDDSGDTEPEDPEVEDAIGAIDGDNTISVNENILTSGTYTLRYVDENDSIIDSFKPITSFTI